MTIETSYLIGPEDILFLVFVCGKCKSKVSIPASSIKYKLSSCPYCQEQWAETARWQDEVIDDFVRTLGKLKTVFDETAFTLKLEVASLGGLESK